MNKSLGSFIRQDFDMLIIIDNVKFLRLTLSLLEDELRKILLITLSKEMVTKDDMEKLEVELKSCIDARVNDINVRVSDFMTSSKYPWSRQ